MNLPTDHITLTSCQNVKAICSPLAMLGINFFCYARFYFDYSAFALVTDPNWYQHFLSVELPKSANVYNLTTGKVLWQDIFPAEAVSFASDCFNINNAFNFHYRHSNYLEVFTFSSQAKELRGLALLSFNIDLLEKFIAYFRVQAADIIKQAESSKIIIPEIMRDDKPGPQEYRLTLEERKKYLEAIGYFEITPMLSVREYQCLYHLAHGLINKDIAGNLGISIRTVEAHVNNLKEKLHCANKSQLARLYWHEQLKNA